MTHTYGAGRFGARMMQLTQVICVMVALSAFGAVQGCSAQAAHGSTAAGHRLDGLLEEFNRSSWDGHQDALQKMFVSQPDRAFLDRRFRDNTGGFELRKIEEETATKVTALLQERNSDQFARISIDVEEAEPHRIVKLEINPIGRPEGFAIPRLDEKDLIAAFRKRVDDDVAADRFSGAVLLAKNGKAVFEQAYGLADRENHVPNTLETRFRIGSMNKMFTAVSILQLVQAGKLGLDEPLGKYLTDYPNKDAAAKVTIRHLLTHMGGTGDFFGPDFDKHRLELKTHEDYVKLYGPRPLRFEPGSKWEYSNYGFLILGAVIDKVSGQSYYDYVRDHVYAPAGMSSTGSETEDVVVPDRSVGYTKVQSSEWQRNTDFLPYRGASAGGGYTTVGDLLRFANALQEHKLLTAQYSEMLTTGKAGTPGESYAFGFDDRVVNGNRCFGHPGGSPGMNGELDVCPGVGYTVVALANLDPPAAQRIVQFVLNRLPEPTK